MNDLTDAEISQIFLGMSAARFSEPPTEPALNTIEFHLASGLVRLIVNGVPATIEALRPTIEALRQPTDEGMPQENRGRFALEQILFCLCQIGKFAFSHATVQKREPFMDALVTDVGEVLWQTYGVGLARSRFLEYFFDLYNAGNEEYARYREPTSVEGESRKGELLWEYGKRMAALLTPHKSALMVTQVMWLDMKLVKRLIPLVRKVVGDTGG